MDGWRKCELIASRAVSASHQSHARISEIVRKKAGGGGYNLYSPNKGKKKNPKPVGEFPTRIAAKRAEENASATQPGGSIIQSGNGFGSVAFAGTCPWGINRAG